MKKKYERNNRLAERSIQENGKELELILEIICDEMQLEAERVRSKERFRPLVTARHIFCYLAKKHLTITYKAIGLYLNRDHTTAINSIQMVENGLYTKDVLFRDVVLIDEKIKQKLSNDQAKIIFTIPVGMDITEFLTTTTSNYEQIRYEVIY